MCLNGASSRRQKAVRDCIHFSDVRSLLKHLRQIKPTHDFKSEVWNYYGKNYTIKSTLKEEYL